MAIHTWKPTFQYEGRFPYHSVLKDLDDHVYHDIPNLYAWMCFVIVVCFWIIIISARVHEHSWFPQCHRNNLGKYGKHIHINFYSHFVGNTVFQTIKVALNFMAYQALSLFQEISWNTVEGSICLVWYFMVSFSTHVTTHKRFPAMSHSLHFLYDSAEYDAMVYVW